MRLAISNIAWRPEESPAIYAILADAGVRGLEIAPGLAFSQSPDPLSPSQAEIDAFRNAIAAHGLTLVSMQSLLFNAKRALLFGAPDERALFTNGLQRAIALAERLAIPNLVMGSPVNRAIPPGLPRSDAEAIACDVFGALADKAKAAGAMIALEPNAPAYGGNFLTTMDEAIRFAALVDHPAVGVNFDIGALHMNGDAADAGRLYALAPARVSHVHVSEPHLAPAPRSEEEFAAIARALHAEGYRGWCSIEMRSIGEDNRAVVGASVSACARQLARL